MFGSVIAIVLTCLLRGSQPLPLNATQRVPLPLNRTLSQRGQAACQSLSTTELMTKLDSFGGYNKRYQAISKVDATKFPNLLKNATKSAVSSVKLSKGRRHTRSLTLTTNITSVAPRGSLDGNGFHRLCTEQSAITTLPTDHFPRYLNEVICDSSDQYCLSFEGFCVQGSLVVNVLKNTGLCDSNGKEQWALVSQPVRTYCECRLFPGSWMAVYL